MTTTWAKAKYQSLRLEELSGNPLAEAIPARLTPTEFATAVASVPRVTEEQRHWDDHERILAARRLARCILPRPLFWQVYAAVYAMILTGYLGRNPFDPRVQEWRYDVAQNRRPQPGTTAETMLLSGISGGGKTTIITSVLSCFPQVIEHEAYAAEVWRELQLVYVYFEIPADATRSGLCLAFFSAVDKALGTEYYAEYAKPRISITRMENAIATICARHYVGAIVVDELQHLNVAKGGGEKIILAFFDHLTNTVRVPVIKIGTPSVLRLFSGQFRSARRAANGRQFHLDRLASNDEDWQRLVRLASRCQWTRRPTDLSGELAQKLYELTQGIPYCLMLLVQLANEEAIEGGTEQITEALLTQVYEERFRLIRPALSELRTGCTDRYEDLASAASFLASNGERGSLRELIRLAKSGALNAKTARELYDFAVDAELECQLGPQQKKDLAKLKKQLQEAQSQGELAAAFVSDDR